MGTYAVALAYRGLFALFPFMLLLVVLVGAFGPSNAIDRLVAEVKAQSSEQVPQQLEPVVEQGREQIQPLEDMARRAERRAEGGLPLGPPGHVFERLDLLPSLLDHGLQLLRDLLGRLRFDLGDEPVDRVG